MDVNLYLLILICFTLVFVRGWIFDRPKKFLIKPLKGYIEEFFSTLLYCSMCTGFWVGLFGSFILDSSWIGYSPAINHFASGLIISILSKGVDKLIFGGYNDTTE